MPANGLILVARASVIGFLKRAEVRVLVAQRIRKTGISEQTFYRWKGKSAGLEADRVRQMALLQEENLRLNQLLVKLRHIDMRTHTGILL